jgi:hypothetical protein
MKRLLLLHGMKRSGNHAFMEWLKANAEILIFNNPVHLGRVLRGVSKMPEPLPFEQWLRRQGRIPLMANVKARNKDVLVSFEDIDPKWHLFSTTPPSTATVLLLRDPYNLFASRIRRGSAHKGKAAYAHPPSPIFRQMIEMWKTHARAFLGESTARPDVPVYYNRWFESAQYRSQIANRLGIQNTDTGLDAVPMYGGGSSFDGQGFDARGREMAVLNRIEKLTEQERGYLAVVQADPEVRALHERVEAATAVC